MGEKGCLKEIFVAVNVGAQGRKSMPLLTILDKAMPFWATCSGKVPARAGQQWMRLDSAYSCEKSFRSNARWLSLT